MRQPGGTPLGKKMTMVEWMVVMAILGILAAIVLPAFMQAGRRARQEQGTSASQQRDAAAREGQDNVIGLPASQERGEPAARRPGGTGLGRIAGLILWIAVFAAIARALRRGKLMRPRGAPPFEDEG